MHTQQNICKQTKFECDKWAIYLVAQKKTNEIDTRNRES